MGEPGNIDIYRDSTTEQSLPERTQQAKEDLQRVYEALHYQPHGNILEIGPGAGGVTRALLELNPDAHLVAIDRNPHPLFSQDADERVAVQKNDVTTFTPDQLRELITTKGIQQVIALRAPAMVVLDLFGKLKRGQFQGVLAVSLLDTKTAEVKAMNTDLHQLVWEGSLQRMCLREWSRGGAEFAYYANTTPQPPSTD